MRTIRYALAPVVALGVLTACSDVLDVRNTNEPDRDRLLGRPADVEALAGSLYQNVHDATLGSINIYWQLNTAGFENATGLANNGMGPRSLLPRGPISNIRGNAYQAEHFAAFSALQQTARTASDIIARGSREDFSLGSESALDRMLAMAWFGHGLALANVALAYDSAAVPLPTDDPAEIEAGNINPLVGYDEVMTQALASFDSAMAHASASSFTLPEDWIKGNALSSQDFIRVIRSHKARYRAMVARTPEERAAVDWTEVVDDALNGITSDLLIAMEPSAGWEHSWLTTGLHFRDANWHQMTPYIIGMADVSGNYEDWLATPRDNRQNFLIVTPDLRFPQGSTRAAQNDAGQGAPTGGRYFRNRIPGEDATGSGWRLSQYDHYRFRAFADNNGIGPFPVMTKAEIDMLAAEGLLRTGEGAQAAALIDVTRTRNGLPSLVAAGATSMDAIIPGGAQCVPRVPQPPSFTTTACGTVFEAMKWEKRMETAYTHWGAWFFDMRGWGDLPEGTALHWPVPVEELDTRRLPTYDLGGVGGTDAAGPSTYGFGSGNR